MAAPARTPDQVALLIHNSNPGQSQQGWTLVSKTQLALYGSRLIVTAVISRQNNSWTCVYTTQADGTLGKVYYVVDAQGVRWRPDWLGGWV